MNSLSFQKNASLMRGQRRRARLVKAERKVRVTQITTHCNSGVQKSILENVSNLKVDRLQRQKKKV